MGGQFNNLLCFDKRSFQQQAAQSRATSYHTPQNGQQIADDNPVVDPQQMEFCWCDLPPFWRTMPPKLHLKYKGILPKTMRYYYKEIHHFFQFLNTKKNIIR